MYCLRCSRSLTARSASLLRSSARQVRFSSSSSSAASSAPLTAAEAEAVDDLASYLPSNLHGTLLEDATSLQLDEVDLHRQLRSYYRKIAFELPQLADHRVAFEPPTKEQVLRFRKTTYLDGAPSSTNANSAAGAAASDGEAAATATATATATGRGGHPSASKVVLEVSIASLSLGQLERSKLIKLAGARYDPRRGLLKMSSEVFHSPSLNQRRLSDTLDRLLEEARKIGPEDDTLEDLPIDNRHVKGKKRPSFPKHWRVPQQQQQQQQPQDAETKQA